MALPVVDAALARSLVADQHPDLAALPVRELASGWDNVTYRLGDLLTVRLPHRIEAVPLLEAEARWLPVLAPGLPLPISAPVRRGAPGLGFPWPWTIGPWYPGSVMATTPVVDQLAAARSLGVFLAALHQPAPGEAPANVYRGVPLARRSALFDGALETLGSRVDRVAARRVWDDALAAPVWAGPPLWLHGDLHSANILVDAGRISAVIDWGDITSGDPAADVMVGWMVFGAEARAAFREAAGHDDATWTRARGWCLAMCLAFLASPRSTDLMRSVGASVLPVVLDDR